MLTECASLDDSGLDIYLKEAQKQGRASAMHFTHHGSLMSDFDLTEEQKYSIKIAVQQHCFFIIGAHTPKRQPQKSRKKVGFKVSKEIKRSGSSCYGQKSDLAVPRHNIPHSASSRGKTGRIRFPNAES